MSIIKDKDGMNVGYTEKDGDVTFLRDENGNYAGYAEHIGDVTFIHDKDGISAGYAQSRGDVAFLHDEKSVASGYAQKIGDTVFLHDEHHNSTGYIFDQDVDYQRYNPSEVSTENNRANDSDYMPYNSYIADGCTVPRGPWPPPSEPSKPTLIKSVLISLIPVCIIELLIFVLTFDSGGGFTFILWICITIIYHMCSKKRYNKRMKIYEIESAEFNKKLEDWKKRTGYQIPW